MKDKTIDQITEAFEKAKQLDAIVGYYVSEYLEDCTIMPIIDRKTADRYAICMGDISGSIIAELKKNKGIKSEPHTRNN